jgi:hypothetical protein
MNNNNNNNTCNVCSAPLQTIQSCVGLHINTRKLHRDEQAQKFPHQKKREKLKGQKRGDFSSKDTEKSQLRQGHHIPYHSSKYPHFI